jgi:sulfur carrier protein ThiS
MKRSVSGKERREAAELILKNLLETLKEKASSYKLARDGDAFGEGLQAGIEIARIAIAAELPIVPKKKTK